MNRRRLPLPLLLLFACTSLRAATLSTADTSIRVEASPAAGVSMTSAQLKALTPLISSATVAGRLAELHWNVTGERHEDQPMARHTFTFRCGEPALEATSTWSAAPGPGPIEHELTLVNRSAREVALPLQGSLAFDVSVDQAAVESFWVEKGAGSPSPVGVHRQAVPDELSLNSTPYSGDKPHEPIPFLLLHDGQRHRGLYVGVESSARVTIALTRRHGAAAGDVLHVEAGLTPDPAYQTRLRPNEALRLPAVFLGAYTGDIDDASNHLRHWLQANVLPNCTDPRYPLLVNNSWGSGMAIDEPLCRRMIGESAELGLEMFHIDAGWFRGVGDWRPHPEKFPNGLAPIADYAHSKNLKFGLWVGWTQGGDRRDAKGADRPLSVFDPTMAGWFPADARPDWHPADFTGQTVCLASPPAAEWCLGTLRRCIKENNLDMLEHDQRTIVDHCSRTDHGHTVSPTDVSHRCAEAYYGIYDTLRRENPDLLFEDCVNGGRMVDFGVLRRAHYISITDTYDPLSNRRAFYDASFVIPPSACECYIENRPAPTLASFLYMLRSGMMGWCTIMTDTTKWTPPQHAAAKRQFELYKSTLRPLIQHADLYHLTDRPDGVRWDAIQYHDPASGRGVLFAFRGTTPEADHRFLLERLDPTVAYEVTSEDGSTPRSDLKGSDLMTTGLALHLPAPESSDLIFLRAR